MRFHSLSLGMLIALASCLATEAEEKEILRKSFLGQTPPEIVSDQRDWLGSAPPTKLAQLHGKVVWLQFNF